MGKKKSKRFLWVSGEYFFKVFVKGCKLLKWQCIFLSYVGGLSSSGDARLSMLVLVFVINTVYRTYVDSVRVVLTQEELGIGI